MFLTWFSITFQSVFTFVPKSEECNSDTGISPFLSPCVRTFCGNICSNHYYNGKVDVLEEKLHCFHFQSLSRNENNNNKRSTPFTFSTWFTGGSNFAIPLSNPLRFVVEWNEDCVLIILYLFSSLPLLRNRSFSLILFLSSSHSVSLHSLHKETSYEATTIIVWSWLRLHSWIYYILLIWIWISNEFFYPCKQCRKWMMSN